MISLRYLPTTDGCIAQVGLDRVVVMSPAAAAQVMADFERLSDESLKRDPTDEWGLGVSWKQAAQARAARVREIGASAVLAEELDRLAVMRGRA